VVLILLGPPGVGKGTQGAVLAERMGWERLATGDLLRTALRDGSPLGEKARSFMESGNLVPDELIVDLVRERIGMLPSGQGVVLDGFPRTLPQGEALRDVLPALGREVDGVLLLEAEDEVLVQRISGRRSCGGCGRVYNIYFDPPVSEGRCDACGAELDARADDAPETVRHRLTVYGEMTAPLIAFYESEGVPLLRVDGGAPLESVREALLATVARHFGRAD